MTDQERPNVLQDNSFSYRSRFRPALEHTADVFDFAATTAVAALAAVEPDVGDPPGSVLTSVGVDPHVPVDFPDGGLAGIDHATAHAPHLSDWFV
jgi:hypothetical protein